MIANKKDLIFVGQAIQLRFTIVDQEGFPIDISGASTKNIILKRKGAVASTVVGVFTGDGTDGELEYDTVTTDLDADGVWEIQALIIISGKEYPSSPINIRVSPRVK